MLGHFCGHCHAHIIDGLRWVREKVPGSGKNNTAPAYRYFHCEPFSGELDSCYEKYLLLKLYGGAT